jgi:hypothetical protein
VALGLVGAHRRSLLGSLAFALLFAAVAGWSLAQFPALRAGLPNASQIAPGLILVLAAGAAGGVIGRGIGSSLAALAPALTAQASTTTTRCGVTPSLPTV